MRKGKVTIIASVLAMLLVAMAVGAGTMAWFWDIETSSGNTFTAGTLDLELTAQTPIDLTNMKPGDSATGGVTVTNVGTLPGSLYATSWYVTADGGVNSVDMSDDNVAKMLLITAFTADGTPMPLTIPGFIPDTDTDGRITLYDFVNDASGASVTGYSDPLIGGHLWFSYDTDMDPSASHTYSLTVQFDPAAVNAYQGDGITLNIEFLLTQQ